MKWPILGGALLIAIVVMPLRTNVARAQQAPAAQGAKADPDWPCVQRKVLALSSTQLWDGPDVTGLSGWENDKNIRDVVVALQDRRMSLEDAVKPLDALVEATPKSDRDNRLKLLFAGLLDSINRDRAQVIAGIERFERRQKELAASIGAQNGDLVALRGKAVQDEGARQTLKSAEDRYFWDVRIFNERQQSITYACEIPVLIEQRAFDAAREIRTRMSD